MLSNLEPVILHTKRDLYTTAVQAIKTENRVLIDDYNNPEKAMHALKEWKTDNGIDKDIIVLPGYGFKSEEPILAQQVAKNGFIFAGPSEKALFAGGDKIESFKISEEADNRLIGHQCFDDGHLNQLKAFTPPNGEIIYNSKKEFLQEMYKIADEYGGSVRLMDPLQGGGRGNILITLKPSDKGLTFEEQIDHFLNTCGIKESSNKRLLVKYNIPNGQHIEAQVAIDKKGDIEILGWRRCTLQYNGQKMLEEYYSEKNVSDSMKNHVREFSKIMFEQYGYVGLGTLEYMVSEENRVVFLEMNTRIQVEHPITEWSAGLGRFGLPILQINLAQNRDLQQSIQVLREKNSGCLQESTASLDDGDIIHIRVCAVDLKKKIKMGNKLIPMPKKGLFSRDLNKIKNDRVYCVSGSPPGVRYEIDPDVDYGDNGWIEEIEEKNRLMGFDGSTQDPMVLVIVGYRDEAIELAHELSATGSVSNSTNISDMAHYICPLVSEEDLIYDTGTANAIFDSGRVTDFNHDKLVESLVSGEFLDEIMQNNYFQCLKTGRSEFDGDLMGALNNRICFYLSQGIKPNPNINFHNQREIILPRRPIVNALKGMGIVNNGDELESNIAPIECSNKQFSEMVADILFANDLNVEDFINHIKSDHDTMKAFYSCQEFRFVSDEVGIFFRKQSTIHHEETIKCSLRQDNIHHICRFDSKFYEKFSRNLRLNHIRTHVYGPLGIIKPNFYKPLCNNGMRLNFSSTKFCRHLPKRQKVVAQAGAAALSMKIR